MQIAEAPILKVLQTEPIKWLERVLREEYAPPKAQTEVGGEVIFTFKGWDNKKND